MPKLDSAALQLKHATRLKFGLRGLKEQARKQRVADVVAAYRADPQAAVEGIARNFAGLLKA